MKHRFLLLLALVPAGLFAQLIGSDTPPDPSADICDIPIYLDPDGTNNTSGYLVGEVVEDFILYDAEGTGYQLSEALAEGPVLLVSGRYTCPRFRVNLNNIAQIQEDFGDQLTVWLPCCVEAHPHTDISPYFGYVNPATSNITLGIIYDQPDTYQDRINTVNDMLENLDVPAPVLLDTPCNDWWDAYGPAENNAYLIETDGTVVLKHGWMNGFGMDLHDDLTTYFGGEVDSTTYDGTFYITDDFTTATQFTNLLLAAETDVINDSEDNVQIQVAREILSATPDWEFSMCFGLCYSPDIDTISFTVFEGYEAEFTLYHYPNGIPGESEVKLTFTNLNNPENTYTWLVEASSDYVGVEEHLAVDAWLWDGQSLTVRHPDCAQMDVRLWSTDGRLLTVSRGACGVMVPGAPGVVLAEVSYLGHRFVRRLGVQ